MPEQKLKYTIEADDSKSAPVHARVTAALAGIEKVAVQAGRTSAAALDAMTTSFIKSEQAARSFHSTVKAVVEVAVGIGLAVKATAAYSLATENLLNTYRAARLLLSPTLFTASTVAIGVAVTETIKLTNARARLIEQDALLASSSLGKRSFGMTSTYSTAERIGRLGAGALNASSAGEYGPGKLVGIVDDFRQLADPIDRADLAVQKFGKDAAAVMPLLDSNLKTNIDRSFELSQALNGPVRESLQRIRDTLQEPGRMLRSIGDDFRYLAESAKQNLAITVTVIERRVKAFTDNPPSTSIPGLGRTESFEGGAGLNSGGPVPDQIPSLLDIVTGAKGMEKGLFGQIGGVLPPSYAAAGDVNRAGGVARNYANTLASLAGQLGAARARVGMLTDQFQRAGADQGLVAGPLIAAQREVQLLEPRVTYLEEVARKVNDVIAYINSITAAGNAATANQLQGATTLSQRNPTFGKEIENFNLQSLGQAFNYTATVQTLRSRGVGINGSAGAFGDISDLIARQAEADKAHLTSINSELAARERIIQLQAGPGGERAAAQQIYDLKVAAADKELEVLQVSKDYAPYQEKIQQAGLDLQVQMAEIERAHFDTIKRSADQLFDSMLGGARNFADALRRVLIAGLLTPVKDAFSNVVASIFTGRGGSVSAAGGGGILGGLLGLGAQGVSLAGAPGGTSGFAGPVSLGGGGGLAGGLGGIAQGGLLAKLGLGGLGSGSAAGLLGIGGAALGLTGAYKLGQTGSLAGKIGAPSLGAVSGLLGFGSLAALFPALIAAGPIGWIAAAGIGATIGLIGAFKSSAEQKIVEKVKSVYGIDIPKSFAHDPLAGIIKEQFGGNLDVGIHSPQIRDLVQLYSMSTGGKNFGPSPYIPHAATFVQGGGSFSQTPIYNNGTAFFSPGASLSNAGPTVIQLDGPATVALLRGEAVAAIAESPGVVASSLTQANRASQSRRTNALLALTPGTL